jgi:hypothetical protein
MHNCRRCDEPVDPRRWALQHTKKLCMPCGEESSKQVTRTIVPMHKGHYFPVFNLNDLKGINNKGGLVR